MGEIVRRHYFKNGIKLRAGKDVLYSDVSSFQRLMWMERFCLGWEKVSC